MKNKKGIYYLMPGIGQKAIRDKQRFMLAWAIPSGLLVSVLIALALYYFNSL